MGIGMVMIFVFYVFSHGVSLMWTHAYSFLQSDHPRPKSDFEMDKFGIVGVVYIFICIFGIIGNGMIVISLAFFLKISSMTEGEHGFNLTPKLTELSINL